MIALLSAVAIGAVLFSLPQFNRPIADRRLARLIAFVAAAGALFSLKLGPLGLMALLVGGGLFAIGWVKGRLIGGEGLGDLSDLDGGAPDDEVWVPPAVRTMGRAEALAVLGLEEGADQAAILAAHRRMISKAHPDIGGSDYLAAKINQARDVLLG